ncbi:amino acid adenylation domain-containing protein [Streptomyces sp. NPDC023998]|uniref:amino acid adenylation domain-containing protein n=1 Tax=Streptomyces sp. NPDC023998 TaxID=3154597 RepID=UPI003408912D
MTTIQEDDDQVVAVPASFAQERMWFLERMENGNGTYNIQTGLRFSGILRIVALKDALDEVMERHEVLRTTLLEGDAGTLQIIHPHTPIDLPVKDLSTADAPGMLAEELAHAELNRPFDQTRDTPLRVLLLRIAPDDHTLILTLDHVAADARSVEILHSEVMAAYAARHTDASPSLPELHIQYADYAVWQREWLSGQERVKQMSYWREQLTGSPALALADSVGHAGGERSADRAVRSRAECRIPSDLMSALEAVARSESTSMMMTLCAAYAVLLGQYSGQSEVVVGTPFNGRNLPETDALIGFFVNTVALRMRLAPDLSFRELLHQARETVLDAFANQDVPFEQVVAEIVNDNATARRPFFDVMFQLVEDDRYPCELPGVRIAPLPLTREPTPFDLVLAVYQKADHWVGVWEYDTSVLDGSIVERMQARYQRILEAIVADPDGSLGGADLVPAVEARWLAEHGRRTVPTREGWTISGMFESTAQRVPDAVALVAGSLQLTYREVDERANRLSWALRARGVRPEVPVGLLLERGADMVVAMLAVLKAGGIHVPLDPSYPERRLAYMIQDVAPGLILTQAHLTSRVPLDSGQVLVLDECSEELAANSSEGLPRSADPENIAYIIYTSGSTGSPKGAAVPHRGLSVIVDALRDTFGLTVGDRVLHVASPSFDASLLELLAAFGAGAALHIPSASEAHPADLGAYMDEHGVTWALLMPSTLAALPEGTMLPSLRQLAVGGEPCPPSLLHYWLRGREVFNLYGPTEASIWSTVYHVKPDDVAARTLPIGRTLPGGSVALISAQHTTVPVGAPGELHIGGWVLARGYHRKSRLTAERFVPDPHASVPGARVYCSGDLGRWQADGMLEFRGRTDSQVKVRGFRIELSEIEARLAEHPAVREAVAIADPFVIAAHVVCHSDPEASEADLMEHLAERLPAHMVPASVSFWDELPHGPNGKVDRRALPLRPSGQPTPRGDSPQTPLEEAIAEIWGEVLQKEGIGSLDDFFSLGGHSLLAARVITRVRRDFDISVPVVTLLHNPVLRDFVSAVVELVAKQDGPHEAGCSPLS